MCLDGVLRGAVKRFDAQVLLDPFEKEFDLPTALVEFLDGERWQIEVVGQEHQMFFGFRIGVADTPQRIGIILGGLKAGEEDGLIGAQNPSFCPQAATPVRGTSCCIWLASQKRREACRG